MAHLPLQPMAMALQQMVHLPRQLPPMAMAMAMVLQQVVQR
jgi:hypothetical protein